MVTFAVNDKEADVSVADVKFSLYETEMKLSTPVGTAHIITGLLGRQNVQNILAAVATGLALDLSLAVTSCPPCLCCMCTCAHVRACVGMRVPMLTAL